jgi:5-methylcytosine-specific restriction endonuclease McrA
MRHSMRRNHARCEPHCEHRHRCRIASQSASSRAGRDYFSHVGVYRQQQPAAAAFRHIRHDEALAEAAVLAERSD